MTALSRHAIITTIALAMSAFAQLALSHDAAAQDSMSYKGKTVTLIINSAAGGGTDLTNRMINTYLANYLPGEPMVVYRNIAGGGGLKANNYFASQVPADGLTFLGGSRTQISPSKVRTPQVKYDPAKYQYIGGDANLGTLMLVRGATLARLTDPAAKPVVYGDFDSTRDPAHSRCNEPKENGANRVSDWPRYSRDISIVLFSAALTSPASGT